MKIMNTAHKFGISLSALLLAATLGCASTPKQEGTGEYVDDSVVTTKVKTAILGDPALKVFQINVETFKGTVQLSGFVNNRAMAEKAVQVATAVTGVKAVRDDMIIR
jgi:osmotically-inducible protein OsmY